MYKFFKNYKIIFFCLGVFVLLFNFCSAQDLKENLDSNFAQTSQKAGYIEGDKLQKVSLTETVGKVINVALGIIGLVLIVLIVYSGWKWMVAGGNDEQVKAARDTIINAVIGLAIILAAYAITTFVINALIEATVAEQTTA